MTGCFNLMNEIWEAKRKKLENRIRTSVLELFGHMEGSQAFLLPLDPPSQILFVVAGDVKSIQSIMHDKLLDLTKEK